MSYYSFCFSLARLRISPSKQWQMKTHIYTAPFPKSPSVLFWRRFFLLQATFLKFFFPFPGGHVCPPLREPNERNACLNSYRIFILCRAAGGMLCLFWCRAKFPTRTICLQSAPSLSLSGSQGKWARNVATAFFQLQASIAGHFCDTYTTKDCTSLPIQ